MQFKIEQVALCPRNPKRAIALLMAIGLHEWAHDVVIATGTVYGQEGQLNKAALAFNYQGTRGLPVVEDEGLPQDAVKPLELEVLHYSKGNNWMDQHRPRVSHLGMHCTAEELADWRAVMDAQNIRVAQEVMTQSHTNPVIAGQRWYNYVIFDTYEILGVDLKFIVRHDEPQVVVHVPLGY